MSRHLGPPWRSRPLGHPGKGWARIEEILQDVQDDAWCFMGDEGPSPDVDPRRMPRPDAGRDRRRA